MTEHPILDHVKALVKKTYEQRSSEIEAFLKQALIDNPDYYIYETWYSIAHGDEVFNPLYKVILAYRFDPSKQIEVFKHD